MMRFLSALLLLLPAQAQAQSCPAPAPVCRAAANVVKISSFEPIGSAVILKDGILVTNRHMVADNPNAEVFKGSEKIIARVAPTDFAGDLVMLRADGIKSAFDWVEASAKSDDTLYVIGFDVGRNAVRVYAPGKLILPKAETERARLHHDARSLPGNSGGALVNAKGELVGIVASGGEGRNEALPVSQLAPLRDMSGPSKIEASLRLGKAYRKCAERLDQVQRQAAIPAPEAIDIKDTCLATNNRQLIDLAAQAFGTRRMIAPALELLLRARALDPHAPNSLLSLVITYHFAGDYKAEVPLVRQGLDLLGNDPQLLRFALQAGIWGGDQALADDAMKRIESALPQMAPAARKFYDAAPPPPRLNPPQ